MKTQDTLENSKLFYNWLRQNKNTGIVLTHSRKQDYAKKLDIPEADAHKIETKETEDYQKGERDYLR
jgi:hypothetical protein